MAGLLSVFAGFEHEILRERVRAGIAHARQNGKRLGRPATAAAKTTEIREAIPRRHQQGRDRAAAPDRPNVCPTHSGHNTMKKPRRDPVREDRIHEEAIVDAGPEEQAMGWYYYLEGKL